MKECICCHEFKPLIAFELRNDTKQYRNKCKKCRRIPLPTKNYCCIDCGGLISKPTALKGNGRCYKCCIEFKLYNRKNPNTKNQKFCVKCKTYKVFSNFHKDKTRYDGYFPYCLVCANKAKDREKEKITTYKRNKNFPWFNLFTRIKQRCNNPNATKYYLYGGKGVKCLITAEELKDLWFRDKAYNMKRPSIDRIDSDGNYEYNNCRFIELSENSARSNYKPILQFDLDGNFIKEWKTVKETKTVYNLNSIYRALKNGKEYGGYIWKYK